MTSADFRALPQLRGTQQRGAARSTSSRTGRCCFLQQQLCAWARLLCATWVLRKKRQDGGELGWGGLPLTLQQQRRQSGRNKCARFLLRTLQSAGGGQHILDAPGRADPSHYTGVAHAPYTTNRFRVVITDRVPVQRICTVFQKIVS
jgi:hypothetical protein